MKTNDNETVREVCEEMKSVSGDETVTEIIIKKEDWLALSDRILSAYERELAAKDAEIARLKAEKKCDWNAREIALLKVALKPVMDCNIAIWADASNAVREAQRVMREGGEK